MLRYDGILPYRKEVGMTSHDVIYCMRRVLNQKKVGHTGTLDPTASGLLLISLGRATKLTQFLTDWNKSYRAEITLGRVSDTLDGAGAITGDGDVPEMTSEELKQILATFVGRINQKVPVYSAVKVAGRELYKYARKGLDVETPQREIEIMALTLDSWVPPIAVITVHCGKGTYIRTLADDIGKRIGCGAYLSGLERLSVGPVTIDRALNIDEVTRRHDGGELARDLIPMNRILDFPMINLRNRAVETIRHGGVPAPTDIVGWQGEFESGDLVSIANEDGELLAIGKSKCPAATLCTVSKNDYLSYVRVLI